MISLSLSLLILELLFLQSTPLTCLRFPDLRSVSAVGITGIPTLLILELLFLQSTPLTCLRFPDLRSVSAVGITGIPTSLTLSKPLSVQVGPLSEKHALLLSDSTPANLLGRDLLCKLVCSIYCSPDAVYLQIPQSSLCDSVASLLSETSLSTPVPCCPLTPSLEHLISQVPSSLWPSHPSEVGRLHTDPVRITVDNSKLLPCLSQYPLNPEAEAGIAPVISALKEQGIIVPCSSPCNTPILPVQKADGKSWRFVQDLRAINHIVIPSFPVVPNPATILASIPPNATHFTVVDLCSTFFSVPVHSESHYLFAFSYKGQRYTWTTLPQGYTESPSYFSQALARDLADLVFPSGSTLIQYLDNLLLCSPSLSASETDSLTLLTALANKGHKASRTKLQLCQTSVTYLGFLLSRAPVHSIRPGYKPSLAFPSLALHARSENS
ncbi:unnamed protein product [Eretmochelys imbricata]